MRRVITHKERSVPRWKARALTVLQEGEHPSRHSLRYVPPQVFVDALWSSTTMVLEGEWEFRMHIVDYMTPQGESMPCAVIDALDMQPFLDWCLGELDFERQQGAVRTRVIVESRTGRALNIDAAFESC